MTKLSRVIHSPTLDDHLLHVSGQHLISEKKCSIKNRKEKNNEAEPHTIWKVYSKPFINNALLIYTSSFLSGEFTVASSQWIKPDECMDHPIFLSVKCQCWASTSSKHILSLAHAALNMFVAGDLPATQLSLKCVSELASWDVLALQGGFSFTEPCLALTSHF